MPIVSLVLSSILGAASASPAMPSKLAIEPCEYGEVHQFGVASCSVGLRNLGDVDIHVTSITGARANDSSSVSQIVVPANGRTTVRVSVSVEDDIGFSKHFFNLTTDEAGQEKRYAEARGFVVSVIDNFKPEIDFGVVDLSNDLPTRSVELVSTDLANLEIENIVEVPPYLDVSLSRNKRGIEAKVKKSAPWGLFEKDRIILKLKSSIQPRVSIAVKADFRGTIVPSLNPIPMGYIRTNAQNEFIVKLTSQRKTDFNVGKVSLSGFVGVTRVSPCTPVSEGCKEVRLLVSNDQPTGQIGGLVSIQLPDFDRTLSVYAWGMLLDPDVQVVDLYEEMDKRNIDSKGDSKSETSADIGTILKGAVKPEPAELTPPPGRGPLVKWAVANEQMLYGYSVYRSEAEDGPYLRINKEMIKVEIGDASSGLHQWRDTTAVPRNVYWYYVGYVERSGKKVRLTSPQRATSK